MSNQTVTITVAAAVGLVAAIGVSALDVFGRGKAAVSATIVVSPGETQCVARTFPATLLVGKKDIVQWTVVGDFTGNCADVKADAVELEFVGACPAGGAKMPGVVPPLFDQNPPHTGRKIRRTLKHGDVGCFAYRVKHGDLELEDPELEIVQF